MSSGTSAAAFVRAAQVRKGLLLEYLTLAWNLLEGAIAIVAGSAAGSVALFGFGIDSLIECSSGAVMIWRLRRDHETQSRERAEKRAQKLVATSLFLLAGWVAVEASESLIAREAPEESPVGIALACASLIVMPLLARAKRRVGREIGSASMVADSKQTELCFYLSAILLAGVGLHALLGWWWADPLSALLMTPIIAKEGLSAWRGQGCGCSSSCAAGFSRSA